MDSKLYVGKIYIIEWLTAGDAKTGWELFGELEPMGLMNKPPVGVSFKRVTNKTEFVDHLRSIRADFRATKRLPLLHIETHGFQDGIGPSEHDQILWPELMEELIPLNQLTQLRLWLVVAACEGLWGLKMAQPASRAAFLALLGPYKPISAKHLVIALEVFYRGIFGGQNGNDAIAAMNAAIDANKSTFGIVNAEKLFTDVYREFLKQSTAEELTTRVEKIVAINKATFKGRRGVGMWKHEIEEARALARQHVEAFEEQFDYYRNKFFFIDLFPDNSQRFSITFDECRKAAE